MALNVIFFVSGIWILQQQAELPSLEFAWLLAAAALLPLTRRLRNSVAQTLRSILLKAACLGLGFFWAAALADLRLADTLPAEWEGRDLQIVGTIANLPQVHDRGVRFEFDVERAITPGASVPRHIVLSWWGSPPKDGALGTRPELHPGERWELWVRLRRPHGTANPHGFDYESWLLERGIRANGYVRPTFGNRRVAEMIHRPAYWVDRMRDSLRGRILDALKERPYAGVIAALAIGDQRAIPQEQWQIFTRTGINHLMSISGLHVTMVSALVFAMIGWWWRKSARRTLWLPAPKAAALAGMMAAAGYALLAGFEVPAQRTLYMLMVVAAALWFGRMSSAPGVLSAALLVVTLLDPWAVRAPGFWLSFGAVTVIFFVTAGRIARPHWLAAWARVQWAVTIALIPPLLALFQQVSIVSPVANAFAIPVVSLAVVPFTLIGMLLPTDLVLLAAHHIMSWCMQVLEWMSAVPETVWQQQAPPAWTVAISALSAGWLLLPRGFPARWLGAVGFLPLFLVLPPKPGEGELKLTVLDVGEGLAAVAQTRNHALLYDTGPAFNSGGDSGNRIIVPYLRATGIRRLDGMIVSHDDADHSGGAESVMQALPVGSMLTSLPDMDPLPLQAEEAYRCFSGQNWEWDGVRFEMLHPSRASYGETRIRNNDRSCVLRITAGERSVLLPADIERRSEERLAAMGRSILSSDVLIAPHQGSRTSSTLRFVREVDPAVVIFTVGYRNRFGHPHPKVLSRYRDAGTTIYRTDRDGALTISINAGGIMKIDPHRAAYRRYWHTPIVGDPVAEPLEW